jgi:hypothetical protein
LQGLDHRSPIVRARTLDVLSERNALDIETTGRALKDDSAIIRLAAVRARDRLGQPLSLDEASKTLARPRSGLTLLSFVGEEDRVGVRLFTAYLAERLRDMAAQPLEALLGSPTYRGAAYRALAARRIGDFGARLRTDLEDGFRRYFSEHWPNGIEAPRLSNALMRGMVSPEEDRKRDLILSALDVIAAQRDKADLSLLRRVIDENGISPTRHIIAYFKVLGSREDFARLARTSQYVWSGFAGADLEGDFNAAAQAILKLAGKPFSELATLSIPEKMRARLIDLVSPTEFARLDNNVIVNLLLSEDDTVRRAAAKKVASSLARTRIAKVLSAYKADQRGVYYLVTHWLDLGLAYSRPISRRVAAGKR